MYFQVRFFFFLKFTLCHLCFRWIFIRRNKTTEVNWSLLCFPAPTLKFLLLLFSLLSSFPSLPVATTIKILYFFSRLCFTICRYLCNIVSCVLNLYNRQVQKSFCPPNTVSGLFLDSTDIDTYGPSLFIFNAISVLHSHSFNKCLCIPTVLLVLFWWLGT